VCLMLSSHRPTTAAKSSLASSVKVRAPDFFLEFLEAAVSQFPVFGFQRATKLLAAPFNQGIMPARRFEPIQVLCDFMKSRLCRRFRCVLRGRLYAKTKHKATGLQVWITSCRFLSRQIAYLYLVIVG